MWIHIFQGFTSEQMQLVDNNTQLVNQRDKEIAHIVRSIQDLNEIFKDLSQMVVDQVNHDLLWLTLPVLRINFIVIIQCGTLVNEFYFLVS